MAWVIPLPLRPWRGGLPAIQLREILEKFTGMVRPGQFALCVEALSYRETRNTATQICLACFNQDPPIFLPEELQGKLLTRIVEAYAKEERFAIAGLQYLALTGTPKTRKQLKRTAEFIPHASAPMLIRQEAKRLSDLIEQEQLSPSKILLRPSEQDFSADLLRPTALAKTAPDESIRPSQEE